MLDQETLAAALRGYEYQLAQVDQKIAEVRARLNGADAPARKRKHHISPEGRARIAEAARRRWAKAKRG